MILAKWWDTEFSTCISPQHSDWATIFGQECLFRFGTQVADYGTQVESKTKKPGFGCRPRNSSVPYRLGYSPIWLSPACYQHHMPRVLEELHPPMLLVIGPDTLVWAVDPETTCDLASGSLGFGLRAPGHKATL